MATTTNQFWMRAVQGGGASVTVALGPTATFNGNEPLTGVVYRGDNQDAIVTFTPEWSLNQQQGYFAKVDVFLTSVQTMNLPPGSYTILLSLADKSMSLASGLLIIYPGPGGASTPFYRCLVTPATAQMYLPDITQQQFDSLPYTLVSATWAIERYCGWPLALDTYDHIVRPEAGIFRFRLKARPVTEILRVSADVGPGVEITNGLSGLSGATVQTVLLQPGRLMDVKQLVFKTTINGIVTSQTITLDDFPTFGALASGINALGYGWTAKSIIPFVGLPTTEAFGSPETRNALNQWIWVHTHCMPIGQYWANTERGWIELNEPIPGGYLIPNLKVERTDSRYWGARVTYRAGFATTEEDIALGYQPVPEDLQIATVATALSMMESIPQSGPINQQSIAGRQYSLKRTFNLIPDSVISLLAPYRKLTF